MSMGNKSNAPPSKGGPSTPSTNPQAPNPYGDQFQPQRYSNDYFRYMQSGQPFNQPVMGYGTYGQIFTPPPQRFQPQPIMGGKGGGMGYRPPAPNMGGKGGGMGYRPPPPPIMGGKGGQGFQPFDPTPRIPRNPGNRGFRPLPERRTQQLGLNQTQPTVSPLPDNSGVPDSFLDFYSRANKPPREILSYPGGSTPSGFVRPMEELINVRPAVEPYYDILNQPDLSRRFSEMSAANSANLVQEPTVLPQDTYYSTGPLPQYAIGPNFDDFARTMQFQEGGQVPPDANMEMMLSEAAPADPQAEMAGEYDRLIQMTMQAILGQVEQPDEIIQMFIEEFGVDAFRQLRDAVLKQQVPNAQTEGMVDGNGGGMDDQVMGMIGAQRPVAVSPGEYIIPADVVSGLGDGSSKSGADILDELSQAVRMARTGTPEQPRPLMETLSQ